MIDNKKFNKEFSLAFFLSVLLLTGLITIILLVFGLQIVLQPIIDLEVEQERAHRNMRADILAIRNELEWSYYPYGENRISIPSPHLDQTTMPDYIREKYKDVIASKDYQEIVKQEEKKNKFKPPYYSPTFKHVINGIEYESDPFAGRKRMMDEISGRKR